MIDVTNDIEKWVICCGDVWSKCFVSMQNGYDEFHEVEEALFTALVLSNGSLAKRLSSAEYYSRLIGVYKDDTEGERSVCQHQKSGIFCQSRRLKFSKSTSLPVNHIDFKGTMLDDKPYAELRINDREFILEPMINLNMFIDI